MKIDTRCVPCLLERIRYQCELKSADKSPEILKACLEILTEEYHPQACSADLATRIHKRCHDILGYDPYEEIKEESNRIALSLLPKAKEMVRKSADPLKAAIIVSITGNVMDFGISDKWNSPGVLTDKFEELVEEGMGYSDLDDIRPLLIKNNNILFFTDNCGEVVFDKLLLKELKELGCRVVVVVKGEPILTDATMKEAGELELDKVVDRVLTTGKFAVGVDLKDMPRELENEMMDGDLIMAKGMANYEALSEDIPIPTAFLLRTKCLPVARAMGLKVEINALKIVYP